jgi:hypothetical protein
MAENSKYNQIIKEKADSFYDLFIPFTLVEFEHEYAKQCALIAVDEIIKTLGNLYNKIQCDAQENLLGDVDEYWENVKTEIQKL